MGCISFHPRKVVTCGEGGMVTTDDDALAELQCIWRYLEVDHAKLFCQDNLLATAFPSFKNVQDSNMLVAWHVYQSEN